MDCLSDIREVNRCKKCDGNHSKCENGKNREKRSKQDCFRRKVCKNGRENGQKKGWELVLVVARWG